MASKKKKAELLHCPSCGMLVRLQDEDFPFCSDRCRKIDLGKWASGAYKISSPILDPEVLEDLGGLRDGHNQGSNDEYSRGHSSSGPDHAQNLLGLDRCHILWRRLRKARSRNLGFGRRGA